MSSLLILLSKTCFLFFLGFSLFGCNVDQYATKICVKRGEEIRGLVFGSQPGSFILDEEETAFIYYDKCGGKILKQYQSMGRVTNIDSFRTIFASEGDSRIILRRNNSDNLLFEETYEYPVHDITLSSKYFVVTTNGGGGRMFLYGNRDFKLLFKWTPKYRGVLRAQIAIDDTETYLIAGGSPSTMMGARWSPISIFNLNDLKPRPVTIIRKAHSGTIVGLIISDDNKYFATTGKDRAVKVWSFPDGKLLHSIQHQRLIPAIAMSHNSKYLFTAGWNEKIKVWNLETKKLELEIDNGATIMSMLVSKDCSEVITGDTDGYVKSRNLSKVLKCL